MTDQATETIETTDARRTAVVAAIRALADLIEAHPDLPVPNSVHAQHSICDDLDDNGRDFIRAVAAKLGLGEREPGVDSYLRLDDDSASARYQVAEGYSPELGSWRVAYVVHGAVRDADTETP
jgi:hypothetical protein